MHASVTDSESTGAVVETAISSVPDPENKRLLFSVVGFHNFDEVTEFCRQVLSLENPFKHDIEIVITVCGGDFDGLLDAIDSESVHLCHASSNLGYFGGCGLGISDYVSRRGIPDWVSVSNTDLKLDKQLLRLIDDVHAEVGMVSPLVVTERGFVQNPGMRTRPSVAKIKKKVLIHRFAVLGALHVGLSRLKTQFMPVTPWPEQDKQRMTVYGAHGSIILLSKAFFEHCKDFSNAPFLYSEELYVAEELRNAGLTALCDTNIRVVHKAHSVTRILSLINISRMTLTSNQEIFERYFKPSLK